MRKRQVRNFLATLFLSQGVPMLVAGDELGRTQMGNNNAYCQDNEISWINWDDKDEELIEFTSGLINFRLEHPAFCRNKWFQHKSIKGIKDIEWFVPDGIPMSEEHWNQAMAKSLAIFLSGDHLDTRDEHGEIITDDSFYIIFNSSEISVIFTLPDSRWGEIWYKVLDTFEGYFDPDSEAEVWAGEKVEARTRSVVMLMRRREAEE